MIPGLFAAVSAGMFGLAIGSFLNVVIYRVPAGLSIVRPPSACPGCGHEIRNRHNVPVLGWLVLGGRCYDCHAPISPRYPMVEATTGLLFAAVTVRLLLDHRAAVIPAALYLVGLCVVAAMIALDGKPLPQSIVRVSFAILYPLLVLAATVTGDWWGLGRAAIATLALAGLGVALPRARAATYRDARELAQLVVTPLAFLSWWTLGFAAAGAVVLAGGWLVLRRDVGAAAAVWMIALTSAAVLLLPMP